MTHPGWPWGQGHRLRNFMLKFFIKVFRSLYLLNMLMDQVDTLHVGRFWSEVLCSTIVVHPGWPWGQGHGLKNFMLKFFIKDLRSLYLLNMLMDQVDTLHVWSYWSEVLWSTIHPGWPWGQGHRFRNFLLKFFVKVVRSLYLLNMLMDQVDTLHVCRYWSEILCFYDPPERPWGQGHGS